MHPLYMSIANINDIFRHAHHHREHCLELFSHRSPQNILRNMLFPPEYSLSFTPVLLMSILWPTNTLSS